MFTPSTTTNIVICWDWIYVQLLQHLFIHFLILRCQESISLEFYPNNKRFSSYQGKWHVWHGEWWGPSSMRKKMEHFRKTDKYIKRAVQEQPKKWGSVMASCHTFDTWVSLTPLSQCPLHTETSQFISSAN